LHKLAVESILIINKGGKTMANTSVVYARIDTNLKNSAENVLS